MQELASLPKILTLTEVCAALRLSENIVLNLINARYIPAIKTGRQWRIRSDDLDNYTRGGTCPSIARRHLALRLPVRGSAISRHDALHQKG